MGKKYFVNFRSSCENNTTLYSSWNNFFVFFNIQVKIDVPFQPLESTVLMYSHASNLDPFIIMGWGPFCKFIFKRSLLYSIPPVFVIAKLYGHIPIDRTNRDSAINSLSQAGKQMAKFKRSVWNFIKIFPQLNVLI